MLNNGRRVQRPMTGWRALGLTIAMIAVAGCASGPTPSPVNPSVPTAAASTGAPSSAVPPVSQPPASSPAAPSPSVASPVVPGSPEPSVATLPSATPEPTATPASPVEQAPGQVSADDAIAALRIGKAYTLYDNPADPSLQGGQALDVINSRALTTMRGREILKSGSLVGYAFVIVLDGTPWSSGLYKELAKSTAQNAGGKVSSTTIAGKKVALVSVSGVSIALFSLNRNVVIVFGLTATMTRTLTASVIKAS